MSWLDGPKIIAIVAYALEGNREKFIEVGMGDLYCKAGAERIIAYEGYNF